MPSLVTTHRVLQIMPADGWLGVFEEHGKPAAYRLVGWALAEDLGDDEAANRMVYGLHSLDMVEFAEDNDSFLGHIHESEMGRLDEWFGERARGEAQRREKKHGTC